jgi:hypothetical protein
LIFTEVVYPPTEGVSVPDKAANTAKRSESAQREEISFELDASEEKMLEEFGTLMSAEYNYTPM